VYRKLVITIALGAGACGGGGGGPPDASPDAYVAPPFTHGVSTLCGFGDHGLIDGDRNTAKLSNPVNAALGPDGKIYVADFDNGAIRRADADGNVDTVYSASNFVRPFGLAFGADGTLYVATDNDDTGGHDLMSGTVWKLDVAAKTATVIVRGIGRARGLAVLPDGKLAMTDFLHDTIRTLDPATGAIALVAGAQDVPGFADGDVSIARFSSPYGVVVVPGPKLVVADFDNQRVREVALDGTTTTIAGSGAAGYLDADALSAQFRHPESLAIDSNGAIYIGDTDNWRVRRLDPTFTTIDTLAGNGLGGYRDDDDRLSAEIYGLEGMVASTDAKSLYVADGDRGEDTRPYHRVRVVTVSP
jgi:sugar lactone lactonase YvrE